MPNLFSRLNYEVPFPGAEYLNESDVSRVVTPVLTPQQGFANCHAPDPGSARDWPSDK